MKLVNILLNDWDLIGRDDKLLLVACIDLTSLLKILDLLLVPLVKLGEAKLTESG